MAWPGKERIRTPIHLYSGRHLCPCHAARRVEPEMPSRKKKTRCCIREEFAACNSIHTWREVHTELYGESKVTEGEDIPGWCSGCRRSRISWGRSKSSRGDHVGWTVDVRIENLEIGKESNTKERIVQIVDMEVLPDSVSPLGPTPSLVWRRTTFRTSSRARFCKDVPKHLCWKAFNSTSLRELSPSRSQMKNILRRARLHFSVS